MEKKNTKKIERELNEIIVSEINARFVGKAAKPNIEKVLDILEDKNREIVLIHQKKNDFRQSPVAVFRSSPDSGIRADVVR
ncbi:MAG: hypothetical protein HC887_13145, partial [Desulfobacteraceae bacterium]|nr:hypothetical protein [Desulfobacteraceae bacterium]